MSPSINQDNNGWICRVRDSPAGRRAWLLADWPRRGSRSPSLPGTGRGTAKRWVGMPAA